MDLSQDLERRHGTGSWPIPDHMREYLEDLFTAGKWVEVLRQYERNERDGVFLQQLVSQ